MPTANDGTMVILSSPSGAGKTTLINLLSEQDNFEISISHTTRQPRPNEVPNKDYYFINNSEFNRLINNQEFLEYAKVFNNYYGSSRTPVINKLDKGKNILFDIDWQGADQIKNKNLDYVVINDSLDECYLKICNLINAEINNGYKDYDPEFIRKHIEILTS